MPSKFQNNWISNDDNTLDVNQICNVVGHSSGHKEKQSILSVIKIESYKYYVWLACAVHWKRR